MLALFFSLCCHRLLELLEHGLSLTRSAYQGSTIWTLDQLLATLAQPICNKSYCIQSNVFTVREHVCVCVQDVLFSLYLFNPTQAYVLN